MAKDYRSRMSAAKFDVIPFDEENLIDGCYDKLIAMNDKFRDIGQEYPGGFSDMDLMPQLTHGQRLLIFLGGFDGEVKNGGITQFFWNCPNWLFDVRDGLEYLGLSKLLRHYEEALESLVGKKDRWLELRKKATRKRAILSGSRSAKRTNF